MKADSKKILAKQFCSQCNHETNQTVIFIDDELFVLEVFFESLKGEARYVVAHRKWQLARCNGCDHPNLRLLEKHQPDMKSIEITFPKKKKDAAKIMWVIGLPVNYRDVMLEIYRCVDSKSLILAMAGMRTVLDMFMSDKLSNGGSFEDKLRKCVEQGIVSKDQQKQMKTIIEFGHAAIHRGYRPTQNDVEKLLKILENLFQNMINIQIADEMYGNVPKRLNK